MLTGTRIGVPIAAALGLSLLALPSAVQAQNGPGVTKTEIILGQTMPYSGPASSYGVIGKAEAAYFDMVNQAGGIDGRKIKLISLDDSYSPPKTVEQTRKLVEEDHILADYNPLGTPPNTAIQKYLNSKGVPQLFVATGATKWGDPAHFHWTMGWQTTYQGESHIYAKYILKNFPNAKIGILYQDDDFGKDYLKGMIDGLGAAGKTMIVSQQSYETTDPTVDSQIVSLKGSGANVFYSIAIPKFAAQAIRKAYDIGWHPTQFMVNVSASVGATIIPAGIDKSNGIISANYLMDPTDPEWDNTADMKAYVSWFRKYLPNGDLKDAFNVYGYLNAQTMVQVLKQCGNNLTRANVMTQAANLKDFHPAMLLPGININTSPTNYYPLTEMQLIRFDSKSKRFIPFGNVISSKLS